MATPARRAPRSRPKRAGKTADPVTAEIILGAFETICYEMATHVSLTATTPILNQSNERNATILDARGQLAALSVGIPQFMLSSTLPVRFAVEFFGADGLFDGDVLVANDPYHGGGHLPDYNVFAPVFHDGECVLIASIQCHHADTGGGAPGGYNVNAPDIWAEGVRFPAVKIFERGEKRRDVEYMMAVNNRTPTFLGDLRAQVGAAQLGVRRLQEIFARFGVDAVRAAVREHHRLRQAPLPRGGGALARRRLRVRRLRRPRSAREQRHPRPLQGDGAGLATSPSTSPAPTTARTSRRTRPSATRAATSWRSSPSMMDPTIPKNEGFFDSIELIVPEGLLPEPARRDARSRPARTIPAPRSARRSRRRSSRWCPSAAARRSTRWACRP